VGPEPVTTYNSGLLTVVEDGAVPEPRVCLLFGWVDGQFLDGTLTPAHLPRVGAFMARLQMHATRMGKPDGVHP
jgi:Ser/Thr protein kinase RdoA (MazF antagonist)